MRYNNLQKAQYKAVVDTLFDEPMTMMELSNALGIERANICRYVATLRHQDKIFIVRYRRCFITNHPDVMVLSTNPTLNPGRNQLDLFERWEEE